MVTVVVFGWIYGLVLWIKKAKDDDPGYMDLETESDSESTVDVTSLHRKHHKHWGIIGELVSTNHH